MKYVRLMIVDDEPAVRGGILGIPWALHQCEVVGQAESGEQALRLIPQCKPDIVLADIVMPGMSGLDMIAQIRKNTPEIKVIILSMHQDFQYAIKAMRMGAFEYLIKDSYSHAELIAAVLKARDAVLSHRENPEAIEKKLWEQAKNPETMWRVLPEKAAFRCGLFHRGFETSSPYPYTSAFRTLSAIFGEDALLLPVAPEKWIIVDERTEHEITRQIQNLTEHSEAAYFCCTGRMPYSAHSEIEALMNRCTDILAESFYDSKQCIVSGQAYDRRFPFKQAEVLQSQLMAALNNNDESEIGAFLKQCRHEHISPEQVKSILTGIIQINRFPDVDSNGATRRVLQSIWIEDALACCKAFLLEGRLKMLQGRRREVQQAVIFIWEHLKEELSVNRIAREVGLSPNYLSTEFKRTMNEGIKKYIVRARMEKAAKMLRETSMMIYEIAEETGFSNYRYFTETFYEYYQMPPSAYREAKP